MTLLQDIDAESQAALPGNIHPTQFVNGGQPLTGAGNITVNPNTGLLDFTVRPGDTLARVFAGNNGATVRATNDTHNLFVIGDQASTQGLYVDGAAAKHVGVFGTDQNDTIVNGGIHTDEAAVYRLYQALFDREPDAPGFAHWVPQITDNGFSINDVANSFTASEEFHSLNVGTNAGFVTLLYQNVLDREPDAEGFDYWVDELDSGVVDLRDALIGFSESQEFQEKTAADAQAFLEGIYGDNLDAATTLDGDDYVSAGEGRSEIDLGEGNDTGLGNGGNDIINGRGGNDHLEGGRGNDVLWGGLDNDALIDTSGFNRLHGEDGNDYIKTNTVSAVFTGSGNDTVVVESTGETGEKAFISFDGADGTDIISFENLDNATVRGWSNPDGDTLEITDAFGQVTQITADGRGGLYEDFVQEAGITPEWSHAFEEEGVNLTGVTAEWTYDIA